MGDGERPNVKIVDVARAANTSVATVSRVLNGQARVNAELAKRVRAAADELGYRPNRLARNLRRRSTSLWLLIISDIEIAFFTSVARAIEDVAVRGGYSVVLCNADERADKEAAYLELAAAEQAAGVIISPHSDKTSIEVLATEGIPVVLIDRSLAAPVDTVTVDSRRGAAAATAHLLERGWLRPACVTGPTSAETAMLRRFGFQDAMRAAGVRATRVVHQPFAVDGGRAATATLFDEAAPPDALFVANAALALGVLQELRARGLRPGDDVGLICFDESPWASLAEPAISVVAQPTYQIGSTAAELLLERIAGAEDVPARHVVLDTELIIRRSSLRA